MLILSIFISCEGRSKDTTNIETEYAMTEEVNGIPKDIILKLESDFGTDKDYKEALGVIEFIRQDNLNVGWIQLSRAVILISDGDVSKMKEIVESQYFGDPRDVLMEMMAIPGNTNNYGMTPFQIK